MWMHGIKWGRTSAGLLATNLVQLYFSLSVTLCIQNGALMSRLCTRDSNSHSPVQAIALCMHLWWFFLTELDPPAKRTWRLVLWSHLCGCPTWQLHNRRQMQSGPSKWGGWLLGAGAVHVCESGLFVWDASSIKLLQVRESAVWR